MTTTGHNKEGTMYLCELIDDDGVVHERFWREGEDADAVREGLEMFQWGYSNNAKWDITSIDDVRLQ